MSLGDAETATAVAFLCGFAAAAAVLFISSPTSNRVAFTLRPSMEVKGVDDLLLVALLS